jgi:uncharacterized repeat protein (TIGR04138 family)
VNQFQSADEVLGRVRSMNGRYHERGFLFVLAALEFCQQDREVRGHIAGQELAESCRDFALEQFGLTARTVLAHWGIESTEDIGRIVFLLIEAGLLMKQESDRLEDFDSVYDFAEAFDEGYPWQTLEVPDTEYRPQM